MKLTDKQKRFCDEYLIDFNATRSAIAAGYSEKTAYAIGNENLKKVEIKEYIESKQNKTSEKLEVKKEDIVKMVLDIAKSKGERTNDRLKAVEIINKMLGMNEAEKHDVKQILEQPLFPDVQEDNGNK